ncbi:hypothetical protein C0J52_26738 [Blattella germanica]|nr:hypothetical protein C0J52_26738 [Blattella germanica]
MYHVDLPLLAAVKISVVSVVVCRRCGKMGDLTESQRGMIVGARLVGASAATVANIVGVSKGTVSNVMRAFSMHGHTTSAKQNSICQIGTGSSAMVFSKRENVQ